MVANIVNLGIDTYNFSLCANTAAKTIDKSLIPVLEKYLSLFMDKDQKKEKDNDNAFCAYYLLTYYYRIYEKMDKLAGAISQYQNYFEQQDGRYALAYQIRGRYLRRIGDGSKALSYDRKANELLQKKGIDNIQVSITNASTISIALENRETYVTEKDIYQALDTVQSAIVSNPEYAKYHYLLAKLKIYSLLYKNDHSDSLEIDFTKQIKEAKESLRTAIELEDPKADSYPTSISEYKTYLRAADLALAEIRLTLKMKEIEESQRNTISTELTNLNTTTATAIQTAKQEVSDKIKEAQDKYLEILALFVSIISIIMVVIGTFSVQFSAPQLLMIIFGLCAGLLAVYSVFLIMLSDKIRKRYVITLIISIILIATLLFFSFKI